MRQPVFAAGFRQCKIANGNNVRAGVCRFHMTAAIGKRVELLGIAEFKPRLIANPGSQPSFEGAVFARIKGSERQDVSCARTIGFFAHNKHHRLVVEHGNDCSIETNANRLMVSCFACHDAVRFFWRRLASA